MNSLRNTFAAVGLMIAVVLGAAGAAAAQRKNNGEVRDSLRALTSKLDDFENNLRYQMQSSSSSNRNVDNAGDLVREMRNEIRHFQDNFDRKRENRSDVDAIVVSARRIDDFLLMYPQNRRVTDDWNGVHQQIDRLASNYGFMPNWQQDPGSDPRTRNANDPEPPVRVGLSGTYSLDRQRSENVDQIIRDSGVPTGQQDDLKSKLDAPEQLALAVRGDQVTIATSSSAPIVFTADGRDKTEQDASGRSVRTRATLNGDTLIISSLGGDTDYTITFNSVTGGQSLKVSRRITTDYLRQTVFADSIYSKTDSVARLGIDTMNSNTAGGASGTGNANDNRGTYSDNDDRTGVSNGGSPSNGGYGGNNRSGNTRGGRNGGYNPAGRPSAVTTKPGNYTVPNGVVLTGSLDNEINTGISQSGDRFKMTVSSPNEYRGAVIQGYVSNVRSSGKLTGQSMVTLNFEHITLPNGQTYDFAGNLQGLTDTFGKVVQIDDEGTARGGNQTNQTAKRGGIGGGLGAVIGAIAGGGKGAVLGAIIGSGVGAGSVYAQGKDDIRLPVGSTVTVQSTSPTNIGPR